MHMSRLSAHQQAYCARKHVICTAAVRDLIAAERCTQYLNSCGTALVPDDLQADEKAVGSHRQTDGARKHVNCTAAVRGHIVGDRCV